MRDFLFALGGAAVATLWWSYGVFKEYPNRENLLGGAIAVSLVLLIALIVLAMVEDKL